MPFQSKAQQRWAHTASGEKALGGPAKVQEWDDATDFSHLPQKVSTHGMLGVPDSKPESKRKPLPRRR